MLTLTPQIIYEMQQRNQQIPSNIQYGVLIWKVIIGSPAHRFVCSVLKYKFSIFHLFSSGGLQPGDIVTEINNKQIRNATDVYSILAQSNSAALKMTVVRFGKNMTISVTPENIN